MFLEQIWMKTCEMLAHLIENSGVSKGQLSFCVGSIIMKFFLYKEAELEKLAEWKRIVNCKDANKEKSARSDMIF